MPQYYNPYNLYPVSYANQMGYSQMPIQQPVMQQSFMPPQVQPQQDDMRWVEGEMGAKVYQMPQGWPVNKILMLWDSTDTNIFLKSWGPMGIPNPIQKLHYTMETQQNEQQRLLSGNQGQQNMSGGCSGDARPDMSQYVTKEEFDQIKNELQQVLNSQNASSGIRMTYSGNNAPQQNNQGNQNGNSGTNNSPSNNNGGNGNRGGNR